METKTIFFAYEDGHQENKDAIKKAAQSFNSHQGRYDVKLWEDLRVSGNIIGEKIFDAINNSYIFACDLTYLNHNVFFELGYAIGCEKRLKIFLNTNISGAKENYSNLDILRNVGYTPFLSSKEIMKELQQNASGTSLSLESIIPSYKTLSIENDVFLINIKNKNQAAIELENYLLEARELKTVFNNEGEIAYQPLIWYLSSIIKSKIVVLHMLGQDKIGYKSTNAEYSLYAGLAYSLGKKLLIIAPAPFRAPIDYTNILIKYESTADCLKKIDCWFETTITKLKLEEEKKRQKENKEVALKEQTALKEINLLKLGLGFGVAESDNASNADNFVEIDAYKEALSLQKNRLIILGRKGSGKTEVFMRLQENLESDKNTFIIIIKPDSFEMIEDIKFSMLYDKEQSRKRFLSTVWRFVVFSKIYNEIYCKTNEYRFTDAEKMAINSFYNENKDMLTSNFYAMIAYLARKFNQQDIMQDKFLLDKINEYIRPMKSIINDFFEKKKYQKIIILADNLDASWDSQFELQSLMITSLFEYLDNISRELENKAVQFKSIVFLREDIFNYIQKYVKEPDKLMMDTFKIDWKRSPIQLENVINKRVGKVLGSEDYFSSFWQKYFLLKGTDKPFDKIQNTVIARPRDVIYFMMRLFENAVNNNKTSIDTSDFDYATDVYRNFLYSNFLSELRAEFPKIDEIFTDLQRKYAGILTKATVIPLDDFYGFLKRHDLNFDSMNKLMKILMDDNYVVGMIKRRNKILSNYDDLITAKEEKIFKYFRRNKILLYVRLTPSLGEQ